MIEAIKQVLGTLANKLILEKRGYEYIIIRGQSMYPTLKDGQVVLMKKDISERDLNNDDLVYFLDPNGTTAIKRLKHIVRTFDGVHLWLEGDNKNHSFDSRSYGFVSPTFVLGKLVKHYKQQRIKEE